MLTMAREMLAESLAALATADVSAREARHRQGRHRRQHLRPHVPTDRLAACATTPIDVANATRIQAITKYIERIGDHAANIAERVIFVLTGEDVRHQPRARASELS